MKALAITPSVSGMRLIDRPEPARTSDDGVKVRVLRVGICGTDREESSGGRAKAPEGSADLVIGHEMIGRVVEVGSAVTRVSVGDFAVFTVRRGCGTCASCLMHRPDMCTTGKYRERGIWGLDGYQTELVVDSEQYVVRVPPEIKEIGVLVEPTSVAEKAIDEAVRIQSSRLPEFSASPYRLSGKQCMVAGLGPIGLLAAMVLRLRGAEVYGVDIVDKASPRPQWLLSIGGHYVNDRDVTPADLPALIGSMDLILEATGIPSVALNLLDVLARSGVYVLTGIPGGDRPLEIAGAAIMRSLVLNNQVMVGSVNAARDHYQMAVDDLREAQDRWGNLIGGLITHRHRAGDAALALSGHGDEEIKVVVEWDEV